MTNQEASDQVGHIADDKGPGLVLAFLKVWADQVTLEMVNNRDYYSEEEAGAMHDAAAIIGKAEEDLDELLQDDDADEIAAFPLDRGQFPF